MRLIFLGDVVGQAGREAVMRELPLLRQSFRADAVIVNGENAAHGFGITEKIYRDLRDAGADIVTLGNHAFDQAEALVFIEREPHLLRPINWPYGCPGRGSALIEVGQGQRLLVLHAMGRVMIEPSLDDPFPLVDRALSECPLGQECDAVVFDFHAEATAEKMGMGHFVDGRCSLMVGTHTHVPTADHQILVGGTAYLTDAGMCGDYDSVIGMKKDEPLKRMTQKLRMGRMEPAEGPATVCGVAVETDDATGLARHIAPIRIGGRLTQTVPVF